MLEQRAGPGGLFVDSSKYMGIPKDTAIDSNLEKWIVVSPKTLEILKKYTSTLIIQPKMLIKRLSKQKQSRSRRKTVKRKQNKSRRRSCKK